MNLRAIFADEREGFVDLNRSCMNAGFNTDCFARRSRIDAFLQCRCSCVESETKRDSDNLGCARVPRANATPARTERVLAIANFFLMIKAEGAVKHGKSSLRRDAETSTRDACATPSSHAAVSFRENQPASTINKTETHSRYAPVCGKLCSRKFAICFTPINNGVNGLIWTGACGSRLCPYS